MKTDYLKLQEGLTEAKGHVKKDGGVHSNYMMKKQRTGIPADWSDLRRKF